jgi:hypothetical protein
MQQPARPGFGTLSGQLRESGGKPAAGVRVFATPVEADVAGVPVPAQLSNISQTDSEGRYRLQDVLPGRYRIAAGTLASPSYYPGGTTSNQGRIVSVAAGQTVTNLDFTLAAVSGRPRDVWGRVGFDDGSSLEVGTLRQFAFILTSGTVHHTAQPFTVQQGIFAFQSVDPGEYVASVAPLRLGYYLKSMTYGSVDLTQNPLTIGGGVINTQIQVVLTKTRPPGTPPGVKVSGHIIDWRTGSPSLELSAVSTAFANQGQPADLFSVASVSPRGDGSFEIEGVPPGRYVISRFANDRSVIFDVAGKDVANLELSLDKRGLSVALNLNSIKSISGTVEVEAGTIPEFVVTFTPTRANAAAPYTVTVSHREFSVLVPEGEYRISISGLSSGYASESVTCGPLDLTEPFLITRAGIADRFTGSPILSRSADSKTAIGAGITVRLRASLSGK